jgi:hypothetical protein
MEKTKELGFDPGQLLEHIHDAYFEAHRGVIRGRRHNLFAVFGNDGYHSENGRARREVAHVREEITARGYKITHFVANGPGALPGSSYTWLLLVEKPAGVTDEQAEAFLDGALWEGWARACGGDVETNRVFNECQRSIASRVLAGIDF